MLDKQQLGLGLMRLPQKQGKVDLNTAQNIIDCFLESGYNYFEVGHYYLHEQCEKVFKSLISDRYPRDTFIISNKFSKEFLDYNYCNSNIQDIFNKQLQDCGVDYFDVYLLHGLTEKIFRQYKKLNIYNQILTFLNERKIKHFGISFHDKAEVLEQIFQEFPAIEYVQIQFNFLDYNNTMIESKKCYDLCCQYNKKIIVMGPNKGGIVNSGYIKDQLIKQNYKYDPNSYGLRFVKSFSNINIILSGMDNLEIVKQNIKYMQSYPLLTDEEFLMGIKIAQIYDSTNLLQCTKCSYCVTNCPFNNNIPKIIEQLNIQRLKPSVAFFLLQNKPLEKILFNCSECGKCEIVCPQKLPIQSLIQKYKSIY